MGDITAAIVLAVFIAFTTPLLMFALALKIGPSRGHWNQPAPGFKRVPGWMTVVFWLVGILHLVSGVALGSEYGLYVVIVAALMGLFWLLLAHVNILARKLGRTNKVVEQGAK